MTLEEKAKEYCKENGVCETIFSCKDGTYYTSEILANFARQEIIGKAYARYLKEIESL